MNIFIYKRQHIRNSRVLGVHCPICDLGEIYLKFKRNLFTESVTTANVKDFHTLGFYKVKLSLIVSKCPKLDGKFNKLML